MNDVRLSCYGTIMRVMNAETFSQNQAARIVGGKMRLEHLIRAGKVRAIKRERHRPKRPLADKRRGRVEKCAYRLINTRKKSKK